MTVQDRAIRNCDASGEAVRNPDTASKRPSATRWMPSLGLTRTSKPHEILRHFRASSTRRPDWRAGFASVSTVCTSHTPKRAAISKQFGQVVVDSRLKGVIPLDCGRKTNSQFYRGRSLSREGARYGCVNGCELCQSFFSCSCSGLTRRASVACCPDYFLRLPRGVSCLQQFPIRFRPHGPP